MAIKESNHHHYHTTYITMGLLTSILGPAKKIMAIINVMKEFLTYISLKMMIGTIAPFLKKWMMIPFSKREIMTTIQ